ncbi:MAG TPA: molybdenum cofactor guanylyltransferase [Candidatus Baltobacteraceae bacterium]|jgi:molybdenum cofactor guanylyltransferase|nr:molybdenum cofactor guanylyltransferase [Candidatus Baltobacteraceae bacterium]
MNSSSQISAFILAGGESSRMGRDKARLELGGMPLILRTARLVESVAGAPAIIGNPDAHRTLGLRVIPDDWPGAGPLGGIATALRAAPAPWNLIVATDLPYLTREWLEYLVARALASRADAVVPMNAAGAEPMCAMYHRRAEPSIRAALERGTRKVTDGLLGILVETITPAEWKRFDSEGLLFKNMNSPEDYEEARAKLGGG